MSSVYEKSHTREKIVTALIPGGDEIHKCMVCGNEINIDSDADFSMVDSNGIKTVWDRKCYNDSSKEERLKRKNTFVRLE